MFPRDRLVLFTRYPVPGAVKTRLVPALGREGAARLQEELTGHAVLVGRAFCASAGTPWEVHFTGASVRRMRRWLGREIRFVPQTEGDLGRRMQCACEHGFQERAARVVVIGSDCPDLAPDVLAAAFAALEDRDLVLGPARDGGYYLIGLRRSVPALFRGIAWGTGTVRQQTLAAARRLGLTFHELRVMPDVDVLEDLAACRAEWPRERSAPARKISVIIPALNEEENLAAALDSARSGAAELIVVDGGSGDATREIARRGGARVIGSPRGRAVQMNAGALAASGDILVFLHADTRLPRGYPEEVRQTLANERVAAGAFSLGIDGRGAGLRWIERAANWRSRRLALPYGDQALFTRASVFRRSGGFASLPIMEDFDWVRRLRRWGRIVTRSSQVQSSSRRWTTSGLLRTTLRHQLIVCGFGLGVPPEKLAALRESRRPGE